ncbi:MAG: hypothetical protein AAFX04_10090 [Pseudomonadota bacterium]
MTNIILRRSGKLAAALMMAVARAIGAALDKMDFVMVRGRVIE